MTEEISKVKQTPDDYLVIRIDIVHVHKGLFGLRDEQTFGFRRYIEPSLADVDELATKLFSYGDSQTKGKGL